MNAHDADAVAALCCEDVLWEDPGAPEILRGREAVHRFHRDIMFPAFPDMRIDLLDVARQIGALPKAGSLGDRIGAWLQHIAARRARRQRP